MPMLDFTHPIHQQWMRKALDEALLAVGLSSPNPSVGALVVRDGNLVGMGHTNPPGGNHAEINALNMAGEAAQGADLYVTLEPCSHFGRTPPCVNAIVKAGISRVFVGYLDPNPVVNGNGIAALEKHGIAVVSGLCAKESGEFYEGYTCWVQKGIPWVTLKIAQSLDGFIAGPSRERTQISGPTTQKWVHALRARSTAILVGGGTAIHDNPQLSVRDVPGNSPLRVVLNGQRELPADLAIFRSNGLKTLVFSQCKQPQIPPEVELFLLKSNDFDHNWEFVLQTLARRGVHHLLVEAGAQLVALVLQNGQWDRFCVITAPRFLGEGLSWRSNLPNSWCKPLQLSRFEPIGEDFLTEFCSFSKN